MSCCCWTRKSHWLSLWQLQSPHHDSMGPFSTKHAAVTTRLHWEKVNISASQNKILLTETKYLLFLLKKNIKTFRVTPGSTVDSGLYFRHYGRQVCSPGYGGFWGTPEPYI